MLWMKSAQYSVSVKNPYYQKLILFKTKFLTLLVFRPKWRNAHLQNIADKAKIIAKKKGLHYSFEIFIDFRKSKNNDAIGAIRIDECEQKRMLPIGIYSNMVMASERDIILTIFHEYCHFLVFHMSNASTWTMCHYLAEDRIPTIYGDHKEWGEENFCESFSYYITDKSVVDSEVEDFYNFLINSNYCKLGTSYKLL